MTGAVRWGVGGVAGALRRFNAPRIPTRASSTRRVRGGVYPLGQRAVSNAPRYPVAIPTSCPDVGWGVRCLAVPMLLACERRQLIPSLRFRRSKSLSVIGKGIDDKDP